MMSRRDSKLKKERGAESEEESVKTEDERVIDGNENAAAAATLTTNKMI